MLPGPCQVARGWSCHLFGGGSRRPALQLGESQVFFQKTPGERERERERERHRERERERERVGRSRPTKKELWKTRKKSKKIERESHKEKDRKSTRLNSSH